jgi:glycerol-3-phosphate dehydrogenase (NAD(P)+)
MNLPVAVIGAGSFGTCLAMLVARNNDVRLWSRSGDIAESINREHRNPRHLTEAVVPDNVRGTTNLEEAVRGAELVICAVPSHGLRDVMSQVDSYLSPDAILVSAVKGIELETGMTMSQVLADVLDPIHHPRITVLSGPSFASEIAQRKPTVVVVACQHESYAISVQATLSCPWFRCYSQTDTIGVELGGALKNVIAIAVGMCDGLDQGHNTRAALMTRGLAEITRLGVELGAMPATFQGLAGMGDLILTCTGDLSRNRRVGIALGQGRNLEDIIAELGEVAEGVQTTRAACRLGARMGVELPIAEGVREILDGVRTPAEAGANLMTRQLRSELDHDRIPEQPGRS